MPPSTPERHGLGYGGVSMLLWIKKRYNKIGHEKLTAWATVAALFINSILVLLVYSQNRNQKEESDRGWISERISIIYEPSDCEEPPCSPKTNLRSRTDAIRAYTALEEKVRLPDAEMRQMSLPNINLSEADLTSDFLQGADLTCANLQEANLSGAWMEYTILHHANMSGAKLKGAHLEHAKLKGSHLKEADLESAVLGECRTGNVDYSSGDKFVTDISVSDLRGAVLKDVSLCGVDFSGSDLTDAKGIEQRELDRAEGDMRTVIPKGLKRPKRWFAKEGTRRSRSIWELFRPKEFFLRVLMPQNECPPNR